MKHFPLIIELTQRDLQARYIGTSLGKFWLLLQPLMLLLIYTLVFSKILNIRFDQSAHSANFAFYLMAGLMAFNGFSESLTRSIGILNQNRNLLLNTPLPAWVLPIVPVLSSVVIELITLVFFVLFFVIIEQSIPFNLWLYPFILLIRLFLSLAGSYFFSIISVFFKDIGQALPMLLTLLLFVSPILYPLQQVPSEYQPLFFYNIFSHLVEAYRTVLIAGDIPWLSIFTLLIISSTLCFVTFSLFQKLIPSARRVL